MIHELAARARELRAGTRAASRAPLTQSDGNWIADRQNSRLLAFLFGLLIWRLTIPGFFDYTGIDTPNESGGGIVDLLSNQMVWLTLLIVPLILMRSRGALAWRLIKSLNFVFIPLLLYIGASTYWSLDPAFSLRRYEHLLIFVVISFGACLVAWEPRRYQSLLRPGITSLLVCSLIFGLVRPDLATMQANYMMGETGVHWRGLTEHKNALGALSSYGVLLWFHGWLYKDLKTVPSLLAILVAVTCLGLSYSSTSMLATAFASGWFLLVRFAPPSFRRYIPFLVMLFVGVILLYAMAVLKLVPGLDVLIDSITSATGKDTTFTGRTPIWELVRQHIAHSPIIGTGYAGYWTGDIAGTESSLIKDKLYFYPTEAHNGYLDVINDLGYVGLSLLVLFFFTYLSLGLRLLKRDIGQGVLLLGLLFYELLSNLAESTWLSVTIPWLLIVFATVDMARSSLNHRLHTEMPASERPRRTPRQPRQRRRPRMSPGTSPNSDRSI